MAREDHAHLLDALSAIDPATLDYQSWVECGMALHESGYDWQDWDDWSARDHRRYHEGECRAKWAGFGSGTDKVTSGSIIRLAEARGWRQPTTSAGVALDWGDVGAVQVGPDATSADMEPIDDTVTEGMDPCRMLYDYLDVLFEDDDLVGYVCECWERDGELKPKRGLWDRTAGQLKRELSAKGATMDKVVGAWEEDAGAWIRFNPLDGNGCGNANVTEYRYALVESDVLEMDRQFPAIRDLHLPCAAVVSSGGKSVHAIVRVDAPDAAEYAKRVRWLYDYCDRHGFVTDKSNKNASRLSRMPGVTRKGRMQMLLATNIGEESWDAWRKWAEESEDDLPDAEYDDWDEPINLKPMLIGLTGYDCILRQGQKMIVVGDSKMGKSYTLIDLAEAICVGGKWLGMECAKGKVFYVNLEIDPQEFRWRQHKVWDERPEGKEPESIRDVGSNFVRWNLRGRATVLNELAPRLVRRVLSFGPPGTFQAIIIDPIYKVNGGDDNDAKAVAKFTNTLDLIIQACGCAVVYAHHHPKGTTGNRKSIDRMSGSGVYGRDADTVLDFSPLYADAKAREEFPGVPLYRCEVNCRSFAYRAPINCLFNWPRFYRDHSGSLTRLKVLGEDPRAEGADKGGDSNKSKTEQDWQRKREAIDDAYDRYPREFDRSSECARDVGEVFEMVNWGAFGLKTPTIDTFRGWFGKGGRLADKYYIGDLKTEMGTFRDSLIRRSKDK